MASIDPIVAGTGVKQAWEALSGGQGTLHGGKKVALFIGPNGARIQDEIAGFDAGQHSWGALAETMGKGLDLLASARDGAEPGRQFLAGETATSDGGHAGHDASWRADNPSPSLGGPLQGC